MVRATRSSASHPANSPEDTDKALSASPQSTKAKIAFNKKRKRNSGLGDSEDNPTAKQQRSDDGDDVMMDDDLHDPDNPSLVAELPLKDDDAQKILDILEVMDTQGLLDRVFPLDDAVIIKGSSSPSGSKTPSDSFSLRTLLKESGDHPLRVYRSAIKQLYPISSQPRSRPSVPAAQQLRFCQLALSLIEMASRHSLDVLSLSPDLVCSAHTTSTEDNDDDTVAVNARRKYALVQRLPNGEWWTSLNLDVPNSDVKDLADLNTAHAELVAILPTPSVSSKPPPTLSALELKGKTTSKIKAPGHRRISCGAFLDYGPNTSFAPTFDSDGADLGVLSVSSVLWRRHEKEKMRQKAQILAERYRKKLADSARESMEVDGVSEVTAVEAPLSREDQEREKQEELLASVFGEDSSAVQSLLDSAACEENVTGLLRNNAKALLRLEELQRSRLGGEGGGSSTVEEGSEEWTIAQHIMESLSVIASLRPRLPNGKTSAILPPASVLRSLQRTLPAEPTSGWYGSLSVSHGLALRDDTTILMKGAAAATATNTTQSTAAVTAPALSAQTSTSGTTPTVSSLYNSNFSYANYAAQQRAAYASQSAAASLYSTAYNLAGLASTPLGQKTQTGYTPQYNTSLGTSQYPYAPWYQPQSSVTTPSRRDTPQPGTGHGTPGMNTAATTYASYSTLAAAQAGAGAGGTAPGTPISQAVANTITSNLKLPTSGLKNKWMTPSNMFNTSGMGPSPFVLPTPAATVNGLQSANP